MNLRELGERLASVVWGPVIWIMHMSEAHFVFLNEMADAQAEELEDRRRVQWKF